MIRATIDHLLQWIFPDQCVGCRKVGINICAACLTTIPRPRDLEETGMWAALPYQQQLVKKLLWNYKYYGRHSLAKTLAQIIHDRLLEDLAEAVAWSPDTEPWIITAIPISKTSYHKRGFNQAEIIAKELSLINHQWLEHEPNLLLKIKNTPRQATIHDRSTRLANLINAYTINPKNNVAGKKIIIIDDVITTGATVTEAKRVLKQAGARRILAIALAHG